MRDIIFCDKTLYIRVAKDDKSDKNYIYKNSCIFLVLFIKITEIENE